MPPAEAVQPKLDILKTEEGEITLLRIEGVVDEGFAAEELAQRVRAVVILDLSRIRRITSFGIRQWMDFLRAMHQRDVKAYAIDCTPRVIDNANLVVGFMQSVQILSFQAPYLCDDCGADQARLMDMVAHRDEIHGRNPKPAPCESCGGTMRFSDDPETYFSYLSRQTPSRIPEEVAAFLARNLDHEIAATPRRTKVQKTVVGARTLVQISGDVDETFPASKVVEGLEGEVVFDVIGVRRVPTAGRKLWRQLIAESRSLVERLWICGMPASLLGDLDVAEDLVTPADVVTLSLPYRCGRCATVLRREIDMDAFHDLLRFASAPDLECTECKGTTKCAAEDSVLVRASGLSQPMAPKEVRDLVAEARLRAEQERPQLQSALAPAAPAASGTVAPPVARASSGGAPTRLVGLGLVALLAAGGATTAALLWTRRGGEGPSRGGVTEQPTTESSHPQAPEWRDKKTYHDGDYLYAVADSSLAGDKTLAFTEAQAAAHDLIADYVGTSIRDAGWSEIVAPLFLGHRRNYLQQLERALISGDGGEIERVRGEVRKRQQRVAANLAWSSAHVAAPDPADFYWERTRTAAGDRYRVWARVRISKSALTRLAEHYASSAVGLGATVLSVFPSAGWRGDLTGGVIVSKLESSSMLRHLGVRVGDLILSIQGRRVRDAADYRRVAEQEVAYVATTGGQLKVITKRGDAPELVHQLNVPKMQRARAGTRGGGSSGGHERGERPAVNLWDEDPNK
ncbi:MAG: hypothetical protein IT371_15855 [Deltaproteobacteria bacterium]|nr:hypothetical protein [Deltaproteobacteria bacterium]